jgi:hypothetical protein
MNIASNAKLAGSSLLSLSVGTLRASQNAMNPTGSHTAGESFAAHLGANQWQLSVSCQCIGRA